MLLCARGRQHCRQHSYPQSQGTILFSYLELIELANGDIVLQPSADEPGEVKPLVTIKFSDESRAMIPGSALEVARAMIQAGMQAVESMNDQPEFELVEDEYKTLH